MSPHCRRSLYIQPNKLAIRKQYRELRSTLPDSIRQQAAISAVKILTAHPVFQSSRHIACYHAYKDEFDTGPLIQAIWQAGKICYLPVLTDSKSLHFVRYEQNDELQLNQYSIPEPVNIHHTINAEKLDLVLAPLVAFDRSGHRIGTGGGFYDRTFAFMYNRTEKTPMLLGVAYEMQECGEIQSEPWDVNLNGVLTENGILLF